MRRWLLLLSLLMASPALSSERSVSLYSEGLVAFHAGKLDESFALMDRAVHADPTDPHALYYRGIVAVRRGDSESGIADLRRAMELEPGFPEAALDLGVALVNQGRPAEAEPLLRQARYDEDLRANATLFLGIAKLRQNRAAESLPDFEEARTLDPKLGPTATYYESIALQRAGERERARAGFESVIAAAPGTDLANEAQRYLEAPDSGRTDPKRYEIYGGYGLDYDSNVVLRLRGESLEALGVETDDDVGMTFGFGGRYAVWRDQRTAVSVGYEFFQLIYMQLDDYNLQGHRPNLRFTARLGDFRIGATAQYEFYLLKTDSYLQRVVGAPWVAWEPTDWGRTELSYRFRWNDFLEPPPGGVPIGPDGDFSDNADALDSLVHQPRLRQYFYINDPRRYVSIAYQYEVRDPTKQVGDPYGFTAHEVEVAGATPIVGDVTFSVSYAYRREDYDEGGRVDEPHQIAAVLRWPFASWIAVRLGYYGEIHDSNQFPYDRHIASTGFDVFF